MEPQTKCGCRHCTTSRARRETPRADAGLPLHPNHSIEFVKSYVQNTGRLPGDRYTGRTTALAFELIAKALREPRKWHCVRDHHGTTMADEHLCDAVQVVVRKAGLDGFIFRRDALTWGLPE